MSGTRGKDVWTTRGPGTWPAAPGLMTVSALKAIEECPRRWALENADYPQIWANHRYPRRLNAPAIKGDIVHRALEVLIDAIAEAGCATMDEAAAFEAVEGLGGPEAVIAKVQGAALSAFRDNPRAAAHLDGIDAALADRREEIREQVQSLLQTVELGGGRAQGTRQPSTRGASDERRPLPRRGAFTEVEIRAEAIGWKGTADLIVVSEAACEISDHKTGREDAGHDLQVRAYATIWALDRERNPDGRLATRLTLRHAGQVREVAAPRKDEVPALAAQLAERKATADSAVRQSPPEARPAADTCRFCQVRHLCGEYWRSRLGQGTPTAGRASDFADLQVRVEARRGPKTWVGEVVAAPNGKVTGKVDVHANADLDLRVGEQIRLLDVAVVGCEDDLPAVATMTKASEWFLVVDQ